MMLYHPAGGARAIIRHAGTEASEDFDFHSQTAQGDWKQYLIGVLDTNNADCAIS